MPHNIFSRWRFALGFALVLSCLPYANAGAPFGFLGAFFLAFALSVGAIFGKRFVPNTVRLGITIALGFGLCVYLLLAPTGLGQPTLWRTLALLGIALWAAWQGWYALHLLAVPVAWVVGIAFLGSLLFALDLPHTGTALPAVGISPIWVHLLILPLYLLVSDTVSSRLQDAAFCGGSVAGGLTVFALLLHTATLLGEQGMALFPQPLSTMLALLPLFGVLENAGAVFEGLLTACVVLRLAVIWSILRMQAQHVW